MSDKESMDKLVKRFSGRVGYIDVRREETLLGRVEELEKKAAWLAERLTDLEIRVANLE